MDSNNPERKTAADVARYINENRGVKNNIQRRVGFYVLHAGVGDRVKDLRDPSVSASRIELAEQGPDVTHIMAYMFAGAGAAAVIVIFVTLILIKRHDRKRDKLGGLQSGISGAESCSKDYQELCRARMAGKNGNASTGNGSGSGGGANEPLHGGRITSLSKENEGKPSSSRSSTSSWSEEPALTNMDISTGHMVLVSSISYLCLPLLLVNPLPSALRSRIWRIIFATRVGCSASGKPFVATRPSRTLVMPPRSHSAPI